MKKLKALSSSKAGIVQKAGLHWDCYINTESERAERIINNDIYRKLQQK